jgi:hypothetical protein
MLRCLRAVRLKDKAHLRQGDRTGCDPFPEHTSLSARESKHTALWCRNVNLLVICPMSCSLLYWRPSYLRFRLGWGIRGLSQRANYTDSERRLPAKLVSTLPDRKCRVVRAADPHSSIFGFLDRSRYFFFQVSPQLYSRG